MSSKHYLFSGAEHEDIRFDYDKSTIEKFVSFWNNDIPVLDICKHLDIRPIEAALITMDLECSDLLKNRKGGFYL